MNLIIVLFKVAPMHPGQHGFRSNHSCDSALTSFVQPIEYNINKGNYVMGALLDAKGAFSNVNYSTIISAL